MRIPCWSCGGSGGTSTACAACGGTGYAAAAVTGAGSGASHSGPRPAPGWVGKLRRFLLTFGPLCWFGPPLFALGLELLVTKGLGHRPDGDLRKVAEIFVATVACAGCLMTIVGLWLLAKSFGEEASEGRLRVNARAFAAVFSVLALLAGGYLCWEGYLGGVEDPESAGKVRKLGWTSLGVGLLGLVYCVFRGQNPEAPDTDLD